MTAKANKLPAIFEQHSYVPSTFQEAMEFCKMLAESDFVPRECKGKPGEIMARLQFGAERGIPPMQALANIAVINGRPTMWGDLVHAMVQRSGLMVHHKEYFETDANGNTIAAVCETQRKGQTHIHVTRFTVEDAKRAGLLGKAGPWQTHPKRMLMFKARHFNERDNFADAIGGLITREEAMDFPNGEPVTDEALKHLTELAEIEEAEDAEIVDSPAHDSQQVQEPQQQPVPAGSETAPAIVSGEADGTSGVGEPTGEGEALDAPAEDDPTLTEAQAKTLADLVKATHPKALSAIRSKWRGDFQSMRQIHLSEVPEFCRALGIEEPL